MVIFFSRSYLRPHMNSLLSVRITASLYLFIIICTLLQLDVPNTKHAFFNRQPNFIFRMIGKH